MSYLQMDKAPIPDMQKGIISFWFREVSKQQPDPPKITPWPQDFWTTANASTTLVPPNAQYSATFEFENSIYYWNSQGQPIGEQFFGTLFFGAASCFLACPPPLVTSTWNTKDGALALGRGVYADTDMSPFGIRTLLTFGDDEIPYNYASWRAEDPGVINAVVYIGIPGIIQDIPPPPYKRHAQAPGFGDNGEFHVRNFRINEPAPVKDFKVAQSFIGIDKDGNLVINLQTNTKADVSGMAFEMSKITEIFAAQTHLVIPPAPPYSYHELGFPFPDGTWVSVDGYWDGYQFEYNDISSQVMCAQPESFVMYAGTSGIADFAFGAPKVHNGGWHHVLFSFDLTGAVSVVTPSKGNDKIGWSRDLPIASTQCQAWLAFDDQEVKGTALQNRPPCHDGVILPKLRGTATTAILDIGPCSTYSRNSGLGFNLGPNDIMPRNAWLYGLLGNPKDGLLRNFCASGMVTDDPNDLSSVLAMRWMGVTVGDFNPYVFTGAIWPLYGHGVAPGPWYGTVTPQSPSTKDVHTFDPPTYNCKEFTIPTNGKPIGVPCITGNMEENTGVEMAELQIWVGQTLDAGVNANRRLFLDYPLDQFGNPDSTKPLQPVPPSVAEATLGKPDILLHGSSNWKKGRNTGKSAFDPITGQPNPDGQFTVVSEIKSFKPDPKLGQ